MAKKVRKVSNNVLLVAVVFVFIGAFLSVWISFGSAPITGWATSYPGTTNVTVTSITSCNMLDNLVSFGEMARDQYNYSDTIKVGGDFMELENDGNVNITIVINATTNLWIAETAPTPYWSIKCYAAQNTNATCDTDWTNIPAVSSHPVVTGLAPHDDADNVTIGFNLTVPTAEPSGYKNGTITFFCEETA
jgi:hypothetical protein